MDQFQNTAAEKIAAMQTELFSQRRSRAEHDAWFRAKVREALDDSRPAVPQKRVEAHFAARRAAARLKEQ